MADSRRYVYGGAVDIEQILAEAQHRWLRPSEICEILRNYQRFRLAPEPPNKPPGGSLFLFDRKTLRYFRKDGHSWRKKKDGKTVREAHEKLKAGSVDVLHCYYAHGEDNENFQRRCYWMLDGQLEHIVLVHYREVNESNRSGVSRLSNVDGSTDGRLCSGPCSSIQANSSAHADQPSYASSPSTADWNVQTPPSDYEEMDSGENIRAVHPGGYAGQNLLECRPSVSHPYGTELNDGLDNPLYFSKMSSHNIMQKAAEDGVLQADASRRLEHSLPGQGLPAWSVVHGLDRNVYEKFSVNEHSENIKMEQYNSEEGALDFAFGIKKAGLDAAYGTIREANQQTTPESSLRTADINTNAVNVKHEHYFQNQDAKVASAIHEVPNEQNYHVTPQVEIKSESPMVIASTDQNLPDKDIPISKNLSSSSSDAKRQGDLNRLDSFGRWMNKEIGKDCDDSLMTSDPEFLWGPLALPQQMQLDVGSLGYSLAQEQLFTILDFSPEWAYSGAKTKVLICGTFLGSLKQQLSHMKWCCMFGEVEVPAELLPNNTLRCQAPVHAPGRVPFYITCSNRSACSEVREFEYREKPYANSTGCTAEPEEEMRLQIRLARMLHLSAEEKLRFACSVENCEKCNLKKQIYLSRNDEKEWGAIEKTFKTVREDQRNPREVLIQKLLKDKLCEWLVCKIHEEGRGPNVLDNEGQGAIHLAASLGYEWAMRPIIAAGVSPTFRDAHGWTGLHWAAYFGREETVITLFMLGAAPGAVNDPTSAFPAGKTAADVASNRGHKGLAGYLAEADLTSHLSSMTLKSGTMDSVSGALTLDEEAKIVDDQKIFSLNGMVEDQLSLRGSLVAVRNSTEAAARIQDALRVQSFIQRQSTQISEDKSDISNGLIAMASLNKAPKVGHFSDSLHTAAVRIQQKYRCWKGRRDFLSMRKRIVRIQAHVRGHQVRKQYKKVVWSVGIVEKAILRWRRKGTGLRGFRVDKPVENVGAEPQKADEYDFLSAARRQKVAGVEKALARVKSMARYPEARDQYMRLVQKSEVIDKEIASTGDTNSEDTNALGR